MDEGGFILDYVTPPGSSLQETNRMLSHIDQIVRTVPEVDSTSRRTGLQLGLAAVTEANTGDISVKLKDQRSRSVEEVIADVRAKVHDGVPIAQPLIESDVFPPMVSQMVKIGEETGELEKMLTKIADFYEEEVDASVASLTSIIEPLMMIGVGIMVGIILIAMYLPMFKMLHLVSGS